MTRRDQVALRDIGPNDAGALGAFHERLSPESQYMRFFSVHPHLSSREQRRFTELDQHDRAGVVATLGDRIVGWAEYDRIAGSDDAELAIVVEDAFQNHGIGTRLIGWLVTRAAECGIQRLVAETLPDNRKVRTLLHESEAQTFTTYNDGVVRVVITVRAAEPTGAEGPEQSGLVPVVAAR